MTVLFSTSVLLILHMSRIETRYDYNYICVMVPVSNTFLITNRGVKVYYPTGVLQVTLSDFRKGVNYWNYHRL